MPYVEPTIISDVDTLYNLAVERWQGYYGDWEPDETSVLALILSEASYLSYEQAFALTQQFANIYVDFGEELYGVPPLTATGATGAVTVVADDTDGHTVEAGTELVTSDGIGFAVDNDVVIAPGSTTTTVGGVTITAVSPGTDANTVSGTLDPVNALSWISSVTIVGVTAGGTDAETMEEYRDRLSDVLSTVSPTAVTADDFMKFARRVEGVERAIVLDAFIPFTNLLTANQASLETDTTGWAARTNTTIARTTAQASSGAASLSITRTGTTGDAVAATTPTTQTPVNPGAQYTARAEFRTAVTARTVNVGIEWYTGASGFISTSLSANVTDSSAAWTSASVTATAPANAAYAVVIVVAVAAVATEVHYVDKIGLKASGTDATWALGETSANVYDAATNTYGNPGYIAVSTIDAAGNPGPSAAVLSDLNDRRMTGITVNYVAPTYNTINVTATVTIDTSRYVALEVINAVNAAIQDYLNPGQWGRFTTGGGDFLPDDRGWILDAYVRRDALYQVIRNVEGILHVDTLSINGNSTTNVLMSGTIPLPLAGTLSITAP